ncbi:uncharacterized protein LOC130753256 [Actinidia eriantha]|uniref:uncharacterized protein LOC130753256 n=1 Tax=Actinidia eriantha TaxID=165200 RepID=UPI00258EC6E8|nr:uncharacterized protein LOC130753256 [Actinidia eriantha]
MRIFSNKESIEDLMYVCAECKFFIHKSFVELPLQIEHTFHPLHPLNLCLSSNLTHTNDRNIRNCHACTYECKGLTFHCSICLFDLDVTCGTQLCNIDSEFHGQKIQHRSHKHPFIPFDVEKSKLVCPACSQELEGSSYGCLQCTFLVHKSCAELQEEILQHPFHPQHPLTIVALKTYELGLCNACGSKQHNVFVYKCAECDFNLNLQCASLMPTIRYERHEHLHLPVNRHSNQTIGDFQCSTCSSTFMGFFLIGVPCNLNIHVKCIPALPHTAEHRAHRHLLTLSDPLPKDDSNEYFRDACEKERNPHHYSEVMKALPSVGEESYVAHQVREAGFILSDSEGREDSEDGEVWEEEDVKKSIQ